MQLPAPRLGFKRVQGVQIYREHTVRKRTDLRWTTDDTAYKSARSLVPVSFPLPRKRADPCGGQGTAEPSSGGWPWGAERKEGVLWASGMVPAQAEAGHVGGWASVLQGQGWEDLPQKREGHMGSVLKPRSRISGTISH